MFSCLPATLLQNRYIGRLPQECKTDQFHKHPSLSHAAVVQKDDLDIIAHMIAQNASKIMKDICTDIAILTFRRRRAGGSCKRVR